MRQRADDFVPADGMAGKGAGLAQSVDFQLNSSIVSFRAAVEEEQVETRGPGDEEARGGVKSAVRRIRPEFQMAKGVSVVTPRGRKDRNGPSALSAQIWT